MSYTFICTILLLISLSLGFIDIYHILLIVFCLIVYLVARSIYLHPNDTNTWKSWLEQRLEDRYEWWKNLSGLRKFYFCLAIFVSSIFLYAFWFIFQEFIDKIDDKDTTFYNLSLAVFAIISGLGAVFGFYTSIIRTETAEQGLITDRLNKATEGLGKNNADSGNAVVEVRLGALYALERIAQDSIRDHVQIMEILCAYVRYNSPRTDETDKVDKSVPLREDIQAALTIIGRRQNWPEGQKRMDIEEFSEYRINLMKCDLHGVRLTDATLNDAQFNGSDMRGAVLVSADMSDAWLYDANLRDACMNEAEMSGAYLKGAKMKGVQMVHAYARTGNFLDCDELDEDQIIEMFLGRDVIIPIHWSHPQEGTDYYETYDTDIDFYTARVEWIEAMAEEAEEAEARAEAEMDQARREQAQIDRWEDEKDRGMT